METNCRYADSKFKIEHEGVFMVTRLELLNNPK